MKKKSILPRRKHSSKHPSWYSVNPPLENHIRFEILLEKKERKVLEEKKSKYIWVHYDNILFANTFEDKIQAVIQYESKKIWGIGHCSMKDLIKHLPDQKFLRVGKFYMINRQHFDAAYDEERNSLAFDDLTIFLEHKLISRNRN